MPAENPYSFACPRCRSPLEEVAAGEMRCPNDGLRFQRSEGIWRFLLPERQPYFERFTHEYETVRRAEGRGSDDPAYYRALPYKDLSGKMESDWRIRAKTFDAFSKLALLPQAGPEALKTLDLGSGNGWLSHQLASRGHRAAAVDLLTNRLDGLGAHVHYPAAFVPVQAEFERLPFTSDQFDLAVFNASLHYATDYERALAETLRCLRPGGRVAILDTPIYHEAESGERMVREREAHFEQEFGFPSDALPFQNYLTFRRLDALARRLGVEWEIYTPNYGLRWRARPWVARLLGRREPATFAVLIAQKPSLDA